ncbi:MAG TPA: hypothetical protein VK638_53440 [Edaphobacter sp.]|nr:hypothetical protein [Edaphobacter sp.]
MATLPNSAESFPDWSTKAKEMAAEAKVLSGNKLEQLVVRIQRHTGRPKDTCWRFVIQYGIKDKPEYRRWTDPEFDLVREELVKGTVEQVAKKLNRTPKAIRNMLRRHQLSLRDIRCDLFSVESLSTVLRVRKSEVVHWIEQGWLEATVGCRGKRNFYIITPEALTKLYKEHQQDLLRRGMRNQTLFEAYLQYCFSPKHTIGEQLLDVRRDKRERAAFAALTAVDNDPVEVEEEDEDDQDEEEFGPSLVDLEELDESAED